MHFRFYDRHGYPSIELAAIRWGLWSSEWRNFIAGTIIIDTFVSFSTSSQGHFCAWWNARLERNTWSWEKRLSQDNFQDWFWSPLKPSLQLILMAPNTVARNPNCYLITPDLLQRGHCGIIFLLLTTNMHAYRFNRHRTWCGPSLIYLDLLQGGHCGVILLIIDMKALMVTPLTHLLVRETFFVRGIEVLSQNI